MFPKVTISASGLPGLTLWRLPEGSEDFVFRSTVDEVLTGEVTVLGTDTLLGGVAYWVWSFACVISFDELLLFEEIRAWQQSNFRNGLDGAITLKDERFYATSSVSGANHRSVVSGSAKSTSWGGTISFVEVPCFLRVPQNYFKQWAKDLYLLEFDAKELV